MKINPHITAKQVAERFDAQLLGDADRAIYGLNEIHNVQDGDISFVDHPKYFSSTLASVASVVIINQVVDVPEGKTLLIHSNPFEVYTSIAKEYQPSLFSAERIASTDIGENSFIAATASIGKQVSIGKNCVIHAGVVIYPYTQIGDNVIIHANAIIGLDAFYYKKEKGEYLKMHTAGHTVICDQVEIGAGSTVSAGVSGITQIGKGTKLDAQVHIGHDVTIGENCVLAAQVGIAGNVKIGNRVTFWGKAGTTKNITIGDDAMIMGSSQVGKSLEGGKAYLGTPAAELKTVAREWAIIKKLPSLWDKLKQL